MPAGRPTDYKAGFVGEVDVYLSANQDIWSEFHKTRGEKSDSYDRIVKVNLPTREGFSKHIGHPRSTVDKWANEYPEFMDALYKIDAEQKERLLTEGLAGNYNPMITKLILSANHGMSERNIQEQTGKDGGPIETETTVTIKHV